MSSTTAIAMKIVVEINLPGKTKAYRAMSMSLERGQDRKLDYQLLQTLFSIYPSEEDHTYQGWTEESHPTEEAAIEAVQFYTPPSSLWNKVRQWCYFGGDTLYYTVNPASHEAYRQFWR